MTGLVCLIGLFNLGLSLFAPTRPADIRRIAPKNLALTYAIDIALATAGIGVQIWLRHKPRFNFVRLIAYALTLAIILSIVGSTLTWVKANSV
jgi:hypothetical protein